MRLIDTALALLQEQAGEQLDLFADRRLTPTGQRRRRSEARVGASFRVSPHERQLYERMVLDALDRIAAAWHEPLEVRRNVILAGREYDALISPSNDPSHVIGVEAVYAPANGVVYQRMRALARRAMTSKIPTLIVSNDITLANAASLYIGGTSDGVARLHFLIWTGSPDEDEAMAMAMNTLLKQYEA